MFFAIELSTCADYIKIFAIAITYTLPEASFWLLELITQFKDYCPRTQVYFKCKSALDSQRINWRYIDL